MKRSIARPLRFAAFALSAALAAGPALADKPEWAGNGKGKGKKHEDRVEQRGGTSASRFTEQHRRLIAEYYGGQQAQPGRKCPPGLAKKNNGCLPPGQAKKWGMGRPLPGDLRYYDLPRDLLMRLPPAPAGHRYVRVAADILLIAVGSSMVIDAVEDLVR
ncbi:MAG: RcnB family protein [Rhodocyclaceae bacterium]|nr:RcnB family protein [Rhodocyclaceae bacterium]